MVIGYLEPHRRPATAAQAEGLAVVPRRRVTYRDTALEEMDLPAVLERAPGAVPDRRARPHQRARARARQALRGRPGRPRRGHRRLLDRQRPAPREPQRPGRRAHRRRACARRCPTRPRAADEVVIVDSRRRRSSSACARARSTRRSACRAALNNFFRIENLAALREVALRQVAERVEAHRLPRESARAGCEDRLAEQARRRRSASGCSRSSRPSRARSASCAARGARPSASAASSTCCGSRPRARARGRASREQLEALRRLASGARRAPARSSPATTSSRPSPRRARARHDVRAHGRARSPRGALARLRGPASSTGSCSLLPGVDVRIVADRAQRPKEDR